MILSFRQFLLEYDPVDDQEAEPDAFIINKQPDMPSPKKKKLNKKRISLKGLQGDSVSLNTTQGL